jgi:hypothetical protein
MSSRHFSGEALPRYEQSPHKERMDRIAQCMVGRRYNMMIDRSHEWLRCLALYSARLVASVS